MASKAKTHAQRWLAAKAEADRAAAELKACTARALIAFDAEQVTEVLTADGLVRLRERTTGSTRLNAKRMQLEDPETYKAYLDEVTPTVSRFLERA